MRTLNKLTTVILLLAAISSKSIAQQKTMQAVDYVDPNIGGSGIVLQPTRPLVHLPNSMMRVFPMKQDQLDDQIMFFPLCVVSHRIEYAFSFLPLKGVPDNTAWGKRFTVLEETTTPYFYSAEDEETGITVGLTASSKSAIFEVDFKNPNNNYFRIGLNGGNGNVEQTGKHSFAGTEEVTGLKTYFYAETDEDIAQVNYQGTDKKRLLAKFNAVKVKFKYGFSYISIEQAKANLYKEIPAWDFDSVKRSAKTIWNNKLGQITIKGGTLGQKRTFYASLYRTYERMVDINEYGQYFSAYDQKVHQSKEPFFVDNWIWDMYIAAEPLHTILDPRKEQQKISSYIEMYKQGGWMPAFALATGDWPAMTGNHAASWMADAWAKGIRGFDVKTAYEGLKKNSLEGTLLPWRNGPATAIDSFYNTHGYLYSTRPEERGSKDGVEMDKWWEGRGNEGVSITLEWSICDWAIAQLAKPAGYAQDKPLFLKRAGWYGNVYNAEEGFVWPKDKNGNWIKPYNTKLLGREYVTENNSYTYNWTPKHDLTGLFAKMGGKEKAEAKLDQLFREDLGLPKFHFWLNQPDASGMVGQFVMGNEPSYHIPYLYNYLGAPWKTQKRIRMLIDTWFPDNVFGIPGDEDGGGTTGFVVLSMMGFFPVTPGVPVYTIGSPSFGEASVKLPSGKTFTVKAINNSKNNVYIQKAMLNGKVLDKPWFTHTDLLKGGTLTLTMGDRPNKAWSSKAGSAPPSGIDIDPEVYR
ncbi:GH92 family glycosyl hydrolase [Mucilaginibacter myungsuensis]|uniref:GH92 family glycosyl hydrolase n=1 Tax=Mucilaginibacter myungsuensis TaxID=649104 RepID=A0A929KUR4_9SPHI|nr:GH92 family glycosyl hydrolase [Mucilaginibacter myungsuensis]MBE9660793.1 GH92 family glycosyl hydrolase [Mucilaginibacter myungsuensis]MDN3600839.1 GH92 family glycosyl hydrolase [Mucilaginibacter myungsuensis]